MKGLIFKLSLAAGFVVSTGLSANQELPICFVVGAGNGDPKGLEKIKKHLDENGIEWHSFRPGEVGTVIERAQALKTMMEEKLSEDPRFRCHLFAYSMGGLVSRYSYHHINLRPKKAAPRPFADVVVSLTTFSSPHRGTPLAAWLKRYAPGYARGVDDLSEESVVKYNSADYPETFSPVPQDIPAFSYLTFMESKEEATNFMSKAGFQLIQSVYQKRDVDPRNDGIVPLLSQPFGKIVAAVQADHDYFDKDLGLRPWAAQVYELHWKFLEGKLDKEAVVPALTPTKQKLTRKQEWGRWAASDDFAPMMDELFKLN